MQFAYDCLIIRSHPIRVVRQKLYPEFIRFASSKRALSMRFSGNPQKLVGKHSIDAAVMQASGGGKVILQRES